MVTINIIHSDTHTLHSDECDQDLSSLHSLHFLLYNFQQANRVQ